MWCLWALLLVSCARAQPAGPVSTEPARPVATPTPGRTLDRQAAELAWRSWLQSPESGNQNAPPRRITTKSLFITPLVCPKGQRLDRNGCVQIVTVNKDEHERILLEQLNALFTSPPSGDVVYDYGDDEPGPLQLSIPIGLDPQAAPLQAGEPNVQVQESDFKVDKKNEIKPNIDATSLEAELEILKLQNTNNTLNDTALSWDKTNINNVVSNFLPSQDKPKRDSSVVDETTTETPENTTDGGQKEQVYGIINVDPIVINTDYLNQQTLNTSESSASTTANGSLVTQMSENNATTNNKTRYEGNNISLINSTNDLKFNSTETASDLGVKMIKKGEMQSKLNPETEYSDIGEAIKLISRYADVTTDDNFDKDQRKYHLDEDSILGTRTKLQHRRKSSKTSDPPKEPSLMSYEELPKDKTPIQTYPKLNPYYRYPWSSQHSRTPPPDYPFRHLQDYWPDRKQIGGVYNAAHENPTRHHHEYPNYFRPQRYSNPSIPYYGYQSQYPEYQLASHRQPMAYQYRQSEHRALPIQPRNNDQDFYGLLGLRHWFSSEGTSDR